MIKFTVASELKERCQSICFYDKNENVWFIHLIHSVNLFSPTFETFFLYNNLISY